MICFEDSDAVVERRPLVPSVPGSNPVMSGFCLWAASTGDTFNLREAVIERD